MKLSDSPPHDPPCPRGFSTPTPLTTAVHRLLWLLGVSVHVGAESTIASTCMHAGEKGMQYVIMQHGGSNQGGTSSPGSQAGHPLSCHIPKSWYQYFSGLHSLPPRPTACTSSTVRSTACPAPLVALPFPPTWASKALVAICRLEQTRAVGLG